MNRLRTTFFVLLLVLTACGTDPEVEQAGSTVSTEDSDESTGVGSEENTAENSEELFPDVVGVEAVHDGDGSWTFHVTLSSPYDSPERYADAWRVVGPDGAVFGERILLHDHAAEQPFTRSRSGIEIPADVTTVTVEGRDQVSGWGGATMEVALER
ncbi:MAG: hypothetical protein OES24_13355 [Acidimicrobiia bacterium]|nr:hypothetical protein [Acidimicrobiia bacterium]